MIFRSKFKTIIANGENGITLLKADITELIKNKMVEAITKERFLDDEEYEKVHIEFENMPNENGIYECVIDYFFKHGKDKYGNAEALEDKHLFVIERQEIWC